MEGKEIFIAILRYHTIHNCAFCIGMIEYIVTNKTLV